MASAFETKKSMLTTVEIEAQSETEKSTLSTAEIEAQFVIDPITRRLQWLYTPAILLPCLLLITVAHGWLYLLHGAAGSLHQLLMAPGHLLLTLMLLFVAAVFHEFGHASALRYGRGDVRAIGVGLYLFTPVLYTDVSDSYRLGRWARVHTDLGGFYFHLLFTLGLIAAFLASGQEFLLAIVVLIDLKILAETLPFVRFDGYWALADLTGIPDFFSHIGPLLRSILPLGAWQGSKLPALKPWVKGIFASYTLVTVCLLALLSINIVWYAPSLLVTTWGALLLQQEAFTSAQRSGDGLTMVVAVLQALILALPLWSSAYLLYLLGRRPVGAIWKWSQPSPKRHSGR